MDDRVLQKRLEAELDRLEQTIDWWADTPKRRHVSELIVEIRRLVREPTPPEYRR